jgi:pimeloyl-ACP methyl ester carboxylesterase
MLVLLPLIERLGRVLLRSRGFVERFVDTPLGRVHAYDAPGGGSLPPVAILHGLGGNAMTLAPMTLRLLPEVRQVIVPEFPGHGFSEASGTVTQAALFDAMTVALDALLVEPTVLVGNSLGGGLALHYAIARPERVRGLVLLSPAGARTNEGELQSVVSAFDFHTRAGAIRFLERVFDPVPLPFRLAAHELPGGLSQRRAVRDIIASLTTAPLNPPEALAALAMPILLVWGKGERLLAPSALAWHRQYLPPHAVIEEPDGMAHVPAPAIAERILRFLHSCAPTTLRSPRATPSTVKRPQAG